MKVFLTNKKICCICNKDLKHISHIYNNKTNKFYCTECGLKEMRK